jgi:hypothetical protein
MSDRETFGPRLRVERERRGISIETLVAVTNVSADLWEGLERGDLSRWPRGIFARSFIRDYARAIGLDENEVIDEFCRLFPIGDRRGRRLLEQHAQLIGHEASLSADAGGLPAGIERRKGGQPAPDQAVGKRVLVAPRTVGTVIDVVSVLLTAAAASYALRIGFYETAGVVAILYYGSGTMTLGTTVGMRVVEAIRHRVPTLFDVPDRRGAHA